jgi:Fe-S-cluster-containing hydrogenase component 2
MACANLCPERALTQIADPDGPVDRLTSEMARCTGCGLCLDVCDSQALSLAGPGQPHPPAQQVFELVRQTCPVCRVSYRRQASPGGASTDEPGPCPTCRRGRPERPDRLVQTSSDPGDNGL